MKDKIKNNKFSVVPKESTIQCNKRVPLSLMALYQGASELALSEYDITITFVEFQQAVMLSALCGNPIFLKVGMKEIEFKSLIPAGMNLIEYGESWNEWSSMTLENQNPLIELPEPFAETYEVSVLHYNDMPDFFKILYKLEELSFTDFLEKRKMAVKLDLSNEEITSLVEIFKFDKAHELGIIEMFKSKGKLLFLIEAYTNSRKFGIKDMIEMMREDDYPHNNEGESFSDYIEGNSDELLRYVLLNFDLSDIANRSVEFLFSELICDHLEDNQY